MASFGASTATYILNTTTIVQLCIVVVIGVAVIVGNVLIIATLWTVPGEHNSCSSSMPLDLAIQY
jgi:hypothetical protein